MILSGVIGSTLAFIYCYIYNIYVEVTFGKLVENVITFFIGSFVLLFIQPNYQTLTHTEEIVSVIQHSLVSEFAFYWCHRFLHMNKTAYMYIHRHHHDENYPTPVDAYLLHPVETVLITLALSTPDLLYLPITYRADLMYKSISLAILVLHHGAFHSFHMKHHKYLRVYFGGTYPLYDYIFNTY